METKLSQRRHHNIERVSIFLVMVVLVVAMMGCGPSSNPETGGPIPYALNISSTAGGSVTVTVNGTERVIGPGDSQVMSDIPAGTDVYLVGGANDGCEFVQWVGAPIDGVTSPATTIDMQDNYEITANFEEMPATYELTMTVSPLSGGTASDETNAGPYEEGVSIAIEAVANQGYQFVNWTAPAGVFGNSNEAETTFTMPAQNVIVTANFEAIPPTYELTMAVSPLGGGTATDETNAGPYPQGASVNIRATANEGYRFISWTAPAGVFGNSSEPETTFTMPAQNAQVTANFELIPTYELTMAVSPTGSGTATDETNAGPYEGGSSISISAAANQGYHFVSWTAPAGVFDNAEQAETTFTMPGEAVTITANFAVEPMIAAGGYHTAGLNSDGTVVATGLNTDGQCDVGSWENIIEIAAGGYHTVGLDTGGTVIAVGSNAYGQCDIGEWTDIAQVAAGYAHTVGLRSDGTVVAVGDNSYGQCDVSGWTGVVQIAAGYRHTVGLKTDGTVLAVGDNYFGQCDVGGWTDIAQVATGGYHTVGLKADGTVVAVGWDDFGQCDVDSWTDIVQVAAGYYCTLGLESDGTVVVAGLNNYGQCNVGGWTDISQVSAGYYHTVGLRTDGSVIAVGLNTSGQCGVDTWNLN
jgi:hypothetical protein